MKVDKYLKSHVYFERFKSDIITVGNHTNFKGMYNKERIENLEKRCEYLERDKKTLLASVGELQKQVYDVSRNKQYLEIANTSLLQETRKTKDVLNEKIKKLRQRLKKSSIRYRDLKESISRNGLKSV